MKTYSILISRISPLVKVDSVIFFERAEDGSAAVIAPDKLPLPFVDVLVEPHRITQDPSISQEYYVYHDEVLDVIRTLDDSTLSLQSVNFFDNKLELVIKFQA